MRLTAIALAWFLGTAAATAAVGQPLPAIEAPLPAPNAPPYPTMPSSRPVPAFPGAPPDHAHPSVPPETRAYAPVPGAASPASAAIGVPKGRADPVRSGHGRFCFNQTETRDKVVQLRLSDPVRAMRAGRDEGEVLRTRLCRGKGDELVYVIYVLRRDGHVVHLYMDAQSGDAVSAADAAEQR